MACVTADSIEINRAVMIARQWLQSPASKYAGKRKASIDQ
jgi:hypothetical protein